MKPVMIILVATLAILSTFVGCTTAPPDLFRTGHLQLEQTATRKVRAMWFSVKEMDGGIEVSGVLKRNDRTGMGIKAHVDITILAPEGAFLGKARSQDLFVPRRCIGRGTQGYRQFSVFFDFLPQAGSVIQVVVHSQEHDPADHM